MGLTRVKKIVIIETNINIEKKNKCSKMERLKLIVEIIYNQITQVASVKNYYIVYQSILKCLPFLSVLGVVSLGSSLFELTTLSKTFLTLFFSVFAYDTEELFTK